jgi:hypothetical protein
MSDDTPHYESQDRFRYKVLVGEWRDPGALVKRLNHLGARGWEVVQLSETDGAVTRVYLKMLVDGEP